MAAAQTSAHMQLHDNEMVDLKSIEKESIHN